MFPTEHHWRMSQPALSENRVPFFASIGGVLHIREDAPTLFPHSVEKERQKGRKTKRQNTKRQKQSLSKPV